METSTTEVMPSSQSNPMLDAIKMQVAELEQALLANDPQMPQYLKRIHSNLLQHPELVHIIQPSERATIIAGLGQLTGVVIKAVEKKAAAKKLASHTVDDI